MSNAWGPLGNPTKEDIQKWCNLPYGGFTSMVKQVCRKKKGKVKTEHTVYLIKEVVDMYVAEVKVLAYDIKDALSGEARRQWNTAKYDPIPFQTKVERYRETGYDPRPLANTKTNG